MTHAALLGLGTVGSGVAEVLRRNAEQIASRLHGGIVLKYILAVHDHADSPFAHLVIHDFDLIEADPEISIVVEAIGGVGAAKEYTERALRAGKSVVTANKELVATHGHALMELAREHGCGYFYEASVGGGIPIIRPLRQCLCADHITDICGILNGTTNYILTQMIRHGAAFETALAQAQEKGYAEADPTADVEGIDAGRKISILASLAAGHQVSPDAVPTQGIRSITQADVAYAASAGRRIKLLGHAMLDENGGVCAFVAPHLVEEGSPLAGVEEVYNAILVNGNAVGPVMFYGQGAGMLPTASAVVNDMMEVVRSQDQLPKAPDWGPAQPEKLRSPENVPFRWYVRLSVGQERARAVLGEAVEFLTWEGACEEMCALLTLPLTQAELDNLLQGLPTAVCFRLLEG